MKCALCGGELSCKQGIHHYTECGLDAVYLAGVDICTCPACDEVFASIPNVPDLHARIGEKLLKKKSLLNGPEIRFLRKNLGLSAKKFARYLSVDHATLSRWENDKQEPTGTHDRLIRLVYASIKGLSAGHTKYLIEEAFTTIRPRKGRMPKIRIPVDQWRRDKTNCAVA